MHRRLSLFGVQEWATHRQEGHTCPSCRAGTLIDSFIGSGLQCSSCLEMFPRGWFRHHYAEIAPMAIQGQRIGDGPLFATIQHWSRKPDGDPDQPHLADFYLDIDREEFSDALDAVQTYVKLFDEHHVPFLVGFSGKKGFWLQIPWAVVGAAPMPYLHERVYRRMAQELVRITGIPVDMALYSPARMWRQVGTRHAGSGLYKVELTKGDLADAKDYAASNISISPRYGALLTSLDPFMHDLFVHAQLEVQDALRIERRAPATRIALSVVGQHPPCISKALEVGPPAKGTRNILNKNMATYFAGADSTPLLEWARTVPGASTTPLRERLSEIRSTLRWAERSGATFSCHTMRELDFCDPTCTYYPLSHRFTTEEHAAVPARPEDTEPNP
jgi:hypothetical protein